jgi:hypothetical protein
MPRTERRSQEEVWKKRTESSVMNDEIYTEFLTVGNMVVADVVEEEATHPSEKRPVNGSSGATEERPLSLAVMGDGGVGVVQESEHNDPVVDEL